MGNQFFDLIREVVQPNRNRHGITPLDGALRANDWLEQACELYRFEAPEDAPDDVLAEADGSVLVSVANRVLRLSGSDLTRVETQAEFSAPTGAMARLGDGRLAVCVDGRGVALVDDDGGMSWLEDAAGAPILCPQAVCVDHQGAIYVADGSRQHTAADWQRDLLEKRRSGRVIRFAPDSGTGEVLLEGLAHPGGLCISNDGKSLVVVESWAHRLSLWPLDNPVPAARSTPLPNMPGYPGRITRALDGGYWLCLFALRTELVELVLEEESFRNEMLAAIQPEHWICPALATGRDPYEMVQMGAVGVLGRIKPWAPPHSYGLILRLDAECEFVASYHSRVGGSRHGMTGLSDRETGLLAISKGHGALVQLKEERP